MESNKGKESRICDDKLMSEKNGLRTMYGGKTKAEKRAGEKNILLKKQISYIRF